MPRRDASFTSADVLRLWDRNLSLVEQRVVIGFFWSLIPGVSTEKKVLEILVSIAGVIPGLGQIVRIFETISDVSALVADVADIFGFGVIPEVDRDLLFALQDCQFLLSLLQQAFEDERLTGEEKTEELLRLRERIVDLDFQLAVKESECIDRLRETERVFQRTIDRRDLFIRDLQAEVRELERGKESLRNFCLQTRDTLVQIIVDDPTPFKILENDPGAIPILFSELTKFLEVLRAI